jgi:hypothetical protein
MSVTTTSITCPHCGFQSPADARNCPLCSSLLQPVNFRRVGLWAAVLVEYLVVVNLLLKR